MSGLWRWEAGASEVCGFAADYCTPANPMLVASGPEYDQPVTMPVLPSRTDATKVWLLRAWSGLVALPPLIVKVRAVPAMVTPK